MYRLGEIGGVLLEKANITQISVSELQQRMHRRSLLLPGLRFLYLKHIAAFYKQGPVIIEQRFLRSLVIHQSLYRRVTTVMRTSWHNILR